MDGRQPPGLHAQDDELLRQQSHIVGALYNGHVEFGGPDPQGAEQWYHGYAGDAGLHGPDAMWLLFHDNTAGFTCWDIKQTRDRVRTD